MKRIKILIVSALFGLVGSFFVAPPAAAVWCGEVGDTGVCTCPPGQVWKIDTGIRC